MGRRCTVCVSEHHLAVDGEIAGGARPAELARRYQLDAEAITRHRNNHLSPALMRVALARRTDQSAEKAYQSVQDRVEVLTTRLEGLLSVAEDRRHLVAAAGLAKELRGCLELLARLNHELDERPVTVALNVLSSPDFARAVNRIVEALAPYPEARLAAAEALDVLDVDEVRP